MDKNNKQAQNEIASYIGRLLREAFGKGPQSVFVSISRPYIVIYLRNFLSPTEKILLQQDQLLSIQHTRDLVMKSLIPELKAFLFIHSGMKICEFYYDWVLHNQSGVLVGIESDDKYISAASVQERYVGKEALHQEIDQISNQIQKSPDDIYSCMINERTLLVVRHGILISIGKELIQLGFEESLKLAERNLEKRHLHNNNTHFQKILNSKIIDVFADWDFHLDKSIFVFILNPSP
ncbi:DUF2294 family protein [Paenibacillus sp. CGMCC 1.16610]|uniref:DUF2294 family protein n=1 Tax=Paenibacillus anseongense TaxID=2682845 RepID=A0ABW9UNT1_9BACL|nr:DUF2294 family protein [Paenibacillus sp. CGMCC 1.16610]MVQ39570.1 DUF2294 family protein [Paenibacillus anseongense]